MNELMRMTFKTVDNKFFQFFFKLLLFIHDGNCHSAEEETNQKVNFKLFLVGFPFYIMSNRKSQTGTVMLTRVKYKTGTFKYFLLLMYRMVNCSSIKYNFTSLHYFLSAKLLTFYLLGKLCCRIYVR